MGIDIIHISRRKKINKEIIKEKKKKNTHGEGMQAAVKHCHRGGGEGINRSEMKSRCCKCRRKDEQHAA